MRKTFVTGIVFVMVSLLLATSCGYRWASMLPVGDKAAQGGGPWQEGFDLAGRTLAAAGRNPYFILVPGFQLVLEGGNEKVAITVLDETIEVDGVITRVVEEREWKRGELTEVSRNFFAIDPETRDVFYFGEDVDDYKDGKIHKHTGAWRAGKRNARAGLYMPGQPYIGQKHYLEIAPRVAMDRAEIVSLSETLATPAGIFEDALKVQETTPLNPVELGYKTYAPGIGMIQDESLLLTEYGFVATGGTNDEGSE
jgi:hypothetical protein